MATVNKDFKIKSGLIVEGANGTINGYDILTKSTSSVNFIVDTIGGTATPNNEGSTVVKRDADGSFAANIVTADLVGNVTGNADTATALETARTIELVGDVTGSVSFDGTANVQISATIDSAFATDTEVATAKGEAQTFATEADAVLYGTVTDDIAAAKGEAIDAAALDATSKADAAEEAANLYTDGRETAITTAYQTYADQAETDAKAYTDARETAITTAYQSYADQAEADAKSYADAAVANLIDGAPELLNTLNELAAAIADDENFATTVISDIATGVQTAKDYADSQDALQTTALQAYADQAEADAISTANTYTDTRETAITTAYQSYADTAEADAISSANSYTDGRETAITTAYQLYADQAETDAKSYTDGEIANLTGIVDGLTTDDVAEGFNQYFTTDRAQDAAGSLLAGATLQNIQITYDNETNSLSITAENGVADSTTDDLEEGLTNVYFTDQRAVDALEAVVPNFTEVDINSVATQVAATQTVETSSQVVAYSFASTSYRSAKFMVKVAQGSHTEVSEVLLTLDTSDNISITEYALVGTNGTLGTVSAGMNGTDVELLVTVINNNSDVTVVGTLLV